MSRKKLLTYAVVGGLAYWLIMRQRAAAAATATPAPALGALPAILEPENYSALSFPEFTAWGGGLNPAVTLQR